MSVAHDAVLECEILFPLFFHIDHFLTALEQPIQFSLISRPSKLFCFDLKMGAFIFSFSFFITFCFDTISKFTEKL